MKYLGIDFGTKRIGIAVSDGEGTFAFPREIIPNDAKALSSIAALAEKEKVGGVVIGNSIASNEERNPLAPSAEAFSLKLGKLIAMPIVFEREDFSSFEAHRYQTSAGHRDDSAAAIILQRFLDKKA